MMYQFDVIVEKDFAGYFVASVPALPGCHTQAKSLDDLEAREQFDFVGIQRIFIYL